jgi:hypothetical protein
LQRQAQREERLRDRKEGSTAGGGELVANKTTVKKVLASSNIFLYDLSGTVCKVILREQIIIKIIKMSFFP